ncbi:MAG: ankyrin repeat domain-containing protein, partial [Verrucomicrobia bacterium]|nr:ankyrin repeat domain-containing protein [Verrucomicrobiota bacterium]
SWLYLAARSGDIESVERLIKAGANINKAKLNGWTALMAASFFGRIEVVKKLLEAGADVNLVNSNHETALSLAIDENHTEIFPLLYAKGATRTLFHKDVRHLMISFGYLYNKGICHGIAHKSIEAFLLGEVDIFNSRLENIITLIEKIEKEGFSLTDLLEKKDNLISYLKQKTDAISPDLFIDLLAFFDGVQLYQDAADYFEFFEQDKKPIISSQNHLDYIKEVSSLTASLKIEAQGGLVEITKFSGIYDTKELIECFEELKKTLEENAEKKPVILQLSSINHAISVGYDVSEKSWIFFDINHISSQKIPDTASLAEHIFSSFVCEKNVAMITKAYSTNCSLESSQETINTWQDSYSFKKIHTITPEKINLVSKTFGAPDISWIHIASDSGDLANVIRLLNAGADANTVNSDGTTPLTTASYNGHIDVVKSLIEAKANINQSDPAGQTALYISVFKGHTEITKALLQAGADVNKPTLRGLTPLIIASYKGHIEVVKSLLEANANINQSDAVGQTPLFFSVFNGHTEITKVLLQAGADVNKSTLEGITPLIAASLNGDIETVKALLKAGADLDISNDKGETALTKAASQGNFTILKMLLELKIKKIFESRLLQKATHNSSCIFHTYQDVLHE